MVRSRARHHRMTLSPVSLYWTLFEWFFDNFIYFYIFYALLVATFYWFLFQIFVKHFRCMPLNNFYLTFHSISKVACFKEVSKKFLTSRCCIRFPHIRVLCQIKYVFVFVLKCNDSIDFLFCFNLLRIGYYNVDV